MPYRNRRICTCRNTRRALVSAVLLGLGTTASAAPTTIAVGDASVVTGAAPTTIQFPLTRSGDLDYAVMLEYRTVDGTAIGGVDYTAAAAGTTVLLDAGQAAASIPIAVAANPTGAPAQSFSLVLDRAWGVGPAPTYAAVGALSAGNGVTDVAFGNLDNLGQLDMVAVNGGANSISVRFGSVVAGNTNLAFGGATTVAVGNAPSAAAIADLDGDGRAEVIVANYSSGTVSVLRNQTAPGAPTPNLTALPALPVPLNANWLRIADVNSDGRMDIVVAGDPGPTHPAAVLLNTTDIAAGTGPSFAAAQGIGTTFTGFGLAVGDVDLDGRVDILVNGPGSVRAFRNTTAPGAATASFAAAATITASNAGAGIALGDLDGDGRVDLARTGSLGTVTVHRNTGTTPGTIAFAAPTSIAVGSDDYALLITDLNTDGRNDLVVSRFSGNELRVLRNVTRPGGAIDLRPMPGLAGTGGLIGIAAADLNGDGIPDLGAAQNTTGSVALWRGTRAADGADVSFAAPVASAINGSPISVTAGDFDLDGKPDLLAANFVTQTNPDGQNVSLVRNTTPTGASAITLDPLHTQTMQIGIVFPAWPYAALAVDLNLDGRPDLASANYGQQFIAWRTNAMSAPGPINSSSFAAVGGVDTASAGTLTTLSSGDLNGDGRADLIANLYFASNQNPDSFAFVLLNSTTPGGAPAFQRSTPVSIGSNRPENAFAIADLNRDGRPDLVATNFLDRTVRTYMNGSPVGSLAPPALNAASIQAISGRPDGVQAADINGDGRIDVVTATRDSSVAVLVNTTAAAAVSANYVLTEVALPASFLTVETRVADVDADGRPDVLAVDVANNRVAILLNRTAPGSNSASFEALPALPVNATPNALDIVDANGDGQPDLAITHGSSSGSLALYRSTRHAASASGTATGTLTRPNELFRDSFE
jgi:hypothetical protein